MPDTTDGPAVVYDLVGFQSRDHGERGIARYVLQLGLALERVRPGLVTQWLMRPDLPFPEGAEPLVASGRVVRADRRTEARWPTAGGVFLAGSPFECFNQRSELVLPTFARSGEWRSLAVVHDLIPAIFPELYLRNRPDTNYYQARMTGLSSFDGFLANSQATGDDVVEMLGVDPAQITVIGAGADDRFQPPVGGPERALADLLADGVVPGLEPGYLLFPTGIDPRKNIDRALEAYGRLPVELRKKHQLVLACRLSDPDREMLMAVAAEAGVEPNLLATGYVDDDVLCRLYQAAHLVLFPSYYEGFGLPALEAMRCGAPVICADATSLKEVQPLAEARFDPLSVIKMARAIERGLTDETLRAKLRNQEPPEFTWDLAAERTAAVIDEQLEVLRSRRAQSARVGQVVRRRLALVAPLPPQETGIATYTHRLLEQLRKLCDVTVFVDTDPAYVWAPEGVEIAAIGSYDLVAASGGAFDRTLYFMGNSRFHIEAMELMTRHPGPVLFHDVRLTELYRELERLRPERLVDGSVGATVASLYPERYRSEVEAMPFIDQQTASRFGLLMAREAAERAESILVHSQHAASLIELDTGLPATVIHGHPHPVIFADRAIPTPAERAAPVTNPVVASFGVVAPSKQPERLISAFALLDGAWAEDDPTRPRLRFVGPIEPHYHGALHRHAEALGIGDRVDFTGRLSDRDFALAQAEATVAVQLRAFSNGESSGAVAELLARGTPTVVGELGAMRELPDDVVVRVPATAELRQVADAVSHLLGDGGARQRLADAALAHAADHDFVAAAQILHDHLFTPESSLEAADMEDLLSPILQAQDRATDELARLANRQAAYLGDHLVLTRLFTGQKLYVDSRDASVAPALILDGRWEPEVTDVFLRLIRPGDHLIDVGANVGYFGIIAGTVIDGSAGGSIHLIEANPRLVPLLFKSINITGLVDRSTVTHLAISDEVAQLELHVPEALWGSACLDTLDDGFRSEMERALGRPLDMEEIVTVPAMTLDQFTAERGIERVDVIKMDIEGHEERAYRGMARTIEQNRDHLRLLLEFSAGQYRDPVGFFDQIRNDFKYVHCIEPGSGELIEATGYGTVAERLGSGFAMVVAANEHPADKPASNEPASNEPASNEPASNEPSSDEQGE